MNLPSVVQDLILVIAPELAAEPLYIVPLPADYPRPACHAFATRSVDFAIRQSLVDTGLWRGPGATIAICDSSLDSESLAGLLLHEAAHLLPYVPIDRIDRDPPAREIVAQQRLVAAWAADPIRDPARCPLHGPQFIRAACHLQHRAAQAGVEIPFPAVVTGWHYQLPPLVRFARALGDEPERLQGETFATILAQPAPASFTHLFRE